MSNQKKQDSKQTICDDCGHPVEIGSWPFCTPDGHPSARPSSAFFAPVVVFKGPNGQIRIPGSSAAKCPKGYVREEITTRLAANKLCQDLGDRDRAKFWSEQEREHHFFNGMLGRNRVEMERMMQDGSIDPRVKEFMAHAMREGDKSDRVSYDPGIYLEVLE